MEQVSNSGLVPLTWLQLGSGEGAQCAGPSGSPGPIPTRLCSSLGCAPVTGCPPGPGKVFPTKGQRKFFSSQRLLIHLPELGLWAIKWLENSLLGG